MATWVHLLRIGASCVPTIKLAQMAVRFEMTVTHCRRSKSWPTRLYFYQAYASGA